MTPPQKSELHGFRKAITDGDAAELERLLTASTFLQTQVNSPLFSFGGRPINAAARHLAVIDVLLKFGADINLRSDWEKGPFSVLDACAEEIAPQLISRGAVLTAHAAARFGWLDQLRRILDANPAAIDEKGGDGQRPLHYAKTPAIAAFLLDRGARIDARCVDHDSTAAQYALKDRPEVARFLLERGATPDIFMAARLGDLPLANRLIDENQQCVAARTNVPGYAPVPVFNIYNWTLGFYVSPHDVALRFDHREVYDLLMARSSPKGRLLNFAMQGQADDARGLMLESPAIAADFSPADHALLSFAILHDKTAAVKLMLDIGLDPKLSHGIDGGTALHMAAWVGNVETIHMLLQRGMQIDALDPEHGATPLSWAAYGSVNRRCETGDYAGAITSLVAAGADIKLPGNKYGTTMLEMADGNPAIQEVLRGLGAQ